MRPLSLVLAAALALSLAGRAAADEKAAPLPRKAGHLSKEDDAAAAKYFTNTELLDQEGRPHRFYEGLLRGRTVIINFAFTSCKGACPTMTANLARVQQLLHKRSGKRPVKEVTLLTITVDAVNDTPSVLRQYAAKFKAGAGWYFLTGTPENVATVLKRLGGLVSKPDEHTSMLLVGDVSTGMWVKANATDPPESVVELLGHLNDALPARPKR